MWETSVQSAKVGMRVIRNEGLLALMKVGQEALHVSARAGLWRGGAHGLVWWCGL